MQPRRLPISTPLALLHLVLALAATGAASEGVRPAVMGGSDAPRGRFPWAASLAYLPFPGQQGRALHNCGGSLINERLVLTAAHCGGIPGSNYKVRVGLWQQDQDPAGYATRSIAAWVPHPGFTEEPVAFDIALALLDAPVAGIPPLALPRYTPKPALPVPGGTPLTVIGWGGLGVLDGEGDEVFPNTLQMGQVQLQPLPVCDAYWPGGGPLDGPWRSNTAVCAGNPPANSRDACGGDSGGALFLAAARPGRGRDMAVGITSFGQDCDQVLEGNQPGKPGIYTDVASLRRWIDAASACLLAGVQDMSRCPGAATCADFPERGCAACDPSTPARCASCTFPGWRVDNTTGVCLPTTCKDVPAMRCATCDAQQPLRCGTCADAHATVDASGTCAPTACLARCSACSACSVRQPWRCTACRQPGEYRLDSRSGRCVPRRGRAAAGH